MRKMLTSCAGPDPNLLPGTHEDIIFYCPGYLITLPLPCSSLINPFNHFIFQCPTFFYHTPSFPDPWAVRWAMRLEQFDRRIISQ